MPIDPVSANSPRPRFHVGCNEGCRPPSGFWIADMLLELQFFFFSIYFCNFPLKYYYFKKFYHTTTAFTGNFPCSLPLLWCSAQLWSQTEQIVSFFFLVDCMSGLNGLLDFCRNPKLLSEVRGEGIQKHSVLTYSNII